MIKSSKPYDIDRLISLFVKQEYFSETEGAALAQAFKRSTHQSFDDFLLDQGMVTKDHILHVLSLYYEVPAFDVTGYFFDHALLLEFPKEILLQYEIIPLELDEMILIVVASNPTNPELLPILGKYCSYDIQFRVGIARDITDAVKEFYDRALTELDDPDIIERERRAALEFLEKERETIMQDLDRPERK